MLYKHYSEVVWDKRRWPNFSPEEKNIACSCCGEFFMDEVMFTSLQKYRNFIGGAVIISSGHRCGPHNKDVKGAKRSEHLRIAFDTSTGGYSRIWQLKAAILAGFTSFGFYETFIHMDRRRPQRIWFQNETARNLWRRAYDLYLT